MKGPADLLVSEVAEDIISVMRPSLLTQCDSDGLVKSGTLKCCAAQPTSFRKRENVFSTYGHDFRIDLDSRDALPSAVEQFSNPSAPIEFDLCHVMTVNHISPTLWAPITTAEFYSALRAIWLPRSGPGTRTPKVGMI